MYIDFGLPKVVLPSSAHGCLCHPFWLLWSHYFWWTFEAAGGVLSVMSQPQKQGCHTLQRVDLARPFLVSPAIKIEIENSLGMALSKAKSGCAWQSHFWQCGTLQAARDTKLFAWRKWIKVGFCLSSQLSTQLGRTTSWSPKSYCVYGPENEIAAVTFFTKTSTDLTNRSAFASPTEWQDPGEHRCWFKVSSPTCMLPIFAKAPCCLELFGCCCRRLSQHGLGEVLILRRHCWPDAFFCVCVGSGSFCHDWASHCSVLFWSFDALFVFGLPLPSPL